MPSLKKITNKQAATMLQEIADVLKMDGVAFKPQAYERAAEAVEKLSESLVDMYSNGGIRAFEAISGVGASIAMKLEEFVKTGEMSTHKKLKKEMPADVEALKLIDGVGVKSIQVLYEKLGIKSVQDLKKAAEKKQIRTLEGFGAKTEEKILESIAFHQSRGDRFLLHDATDAARAVAASIEAFDGVRRVAVAGSIRRGRETIGDADVLVIADDGAAIGEQVSKLPEVEHVYGMGDTKTMVRLSNGMDLDVRVVQENAWGAALNYFTGSREHNVRLRKIAQKLGWSLNEYGILKGKKRFSMKTEEALYKALQLAYVDPEIREDIGEIDEAAAAFKAGKHMPRLVEVEDLKGDLQTQSDWTDGKHSIERLAEAAKEKGLSYIAITDHTKRLAMIGGLDAKKLRKQMAEIDALNKKISGIGILRGTECDILRDGSLDLPDDVLSDLDVVGISVHSFFDLSKQEQTKRVITAMENLNVDILFHPTGRIVGRRAPIRLDFEAIVDAAVRLNVVLEINGTSRLDLNGEHVRVARKKGAKFAVSSDAHAVEHFAFLDFGITQARRGGAIASDIINTQPLARMQRSLRRNK